MDNHLKCRMQLWPILIYEPLKFTSEWRCAACTLYSNCLLHGEQHSCDCRHCIACSVQWVRAETVRLATILCSCENILLCDLFITVLTAFWGESFRLSPILRWVMREEMNSFVLSALLREQRGKKRARVWLPCWVCSECRGDEHCSSGRELMWAVQCKAAQFIKRVCCVSQMRRIRGGRDSVWLTGRGSVPTGQRWPEASWKLARSIFHPC